MQKAVKALKSKIKGKLGMQKTATDLYNEYMAGKLGKVAAFQLVSKTIPAANDSWTKTEAKVLESDKIAVLRLSRRSENLFEIAYFDEVKKAQSAIIVPKDFLFKMPTKAAEKKILKAYHKTALVNLWKNAPYYGGKVGSDPEIFAADENGEVIPAFNFLGSKEKPTVAPSRSYGGNACYWDGFQAEFTTQAMDCLGWHMDSIQCGLEGVYLAMKKHNPKAKLTAKTVMDIKPELIEKSAPEHVQFGCMPSFNIYGLKGLGLPGNQVFNRAAGGHIHLGCGKLDKATLERVIKSMDAVLGVAGVSLFAKYDDPRRREMYGLAGEYRLPPHGLEYRVLSNAWLFHPLMANIVFDLARGAFALGQYDFFQFWEATEKETIKAINECDVKLARKILLRNKDLLKEVIGIKYGGNREKIDFVYEIIMNGAESVVQDMNDIEKNWNLGGEWRTHSDGPGKNVEKSMPIVSMKKKV